MNNQEFAKILIEMSTLLELGQDNPFRIRAYQRAAQVIEGLTKDISNISKEELLKIAGIGKGIAFKVEEYLKTHQLQEYETLKDKFPKGLLEVMTLPGLGPKRAKILFDKLGIDHPSKLKKAAQTGQLKELAGFGEKLEQSILSGFSFAIEAEKRMLNWKAKRIAQEIIKQLKSQDIKNIIPAGSLRRGKETVGDLDILCIAEGRTNVMNRFTHMPNVTRILAAGETKASVFLSEGIQCDLRVVSPESFGAALMYFTGSKEHNVALRELVQKKGLTINEYGLYKKSKSASKKPVAGRTEEEIYNKLGMDYIPPELRENRGEIQAALKHRLPKLIEEKDIRGDFHNHTDLSDGTNTLEEMVEAAKLKGWEWVAIGDHSASLKIANGLSIERLNRKMRKIHEMNKKNKKFHILTASEVDILSDGEMDYPDTILKEIDFVVGSIHSGFKQPEEKTTSRVLKAMENPHVDCIGHLSGRIINRRPPYAINTEKILEGARRTGTALEINGQPDRQDMTDLIAKAARDKGIKMATNSDAHSSEQFDYVSSAVTIARRAWLEKKTYYQLYELSRN